MARVHRHAAEYIPPNSSVLDEARRRPAFVLEDLAIRLLPPDDDGRRRSALSPAPRSPGPVRIATVAGAPGDGGRHDPGTRGLHESPVPGWHVAVLLRQRTPAPGAASPDSPRRPVPDPRNGRRSRGSLRHTAPPLDRGVQSPDLVRRPRRP